MARRRRNPAQEPPAAAPDTPVEEEVVEPESESDAEPQPEMEETELEVAEEEEPLAEEEPDFGPGRVGQLRLAFYRRAQEFLELLALARTQLEAANVHRLRVAGRRLDATLTALAALIGNRPVKKLRRQVKEVRQSLGTLRDLHRQLEWLSDEPLLDELLTERAAELPRLVSRAAKKLDRVRVRKFEKKLELVDALLAALLDEEEGEENAREILSRQIWESLLVAMARADQVDPDHSFSYHPLRVALKNFRYQAEVYTLSGWACALDENEGWDRLRELHHALGDLQDLEVLSCHLDLYWAESPPNRETQARIVNRLLKQRHQVLSRIHLQDLDWELLWEWPQGEEEELGEQE